MAGIYIHIPFCRKACHYCNFHFSTTLHYKEKLCEAITKELSLRKSELANLAIETIYFGGGTPSLLLASELDLILSSLNDNFDLSKVKEFTLEANPDDLNPAFLSYLQTTPINRLSIGIQSFEANHLSWMNRAHTADEGEKSVKLAKAYGFHSLSLDLIYGLPNLSKVQWESNIQKALALQPDHISAYCLTVEQGTALAHEVKKGKVKLIDEELAEAQFLYLRKLLIENGYEHYEISNFAKPGKFALHNTNYWKGETYLGIGPGAHSFSGLERSWNVSHNLQYINAINSGQLPIETETLTENNRVNEYIMTSLRTQWGISLKWFEETFGSERLEILQKQVEPFITQGKIIEADNYFKLSEAGLFFADGIAADLFQLD
jgi:oxygen-independent coproporphyrinogen-3 oxidase